MPRIVSANVVRPDGRAFEAKIANLTLSSLFLITREALNFRERVSVSVLGVTVEGEVAFAIAEPRLGAVITFHCTRAVKDTLSRHLDEIEVFAVALGSPKSGTVEEEWLEPTTAANMNPARDPDKEPTVEPPVVADSQVNLRWSERTSMKPTAPVAVQAADGIDLETVDEMPVDPDTLVPVDGGTKQDYADSPTPQNMPVIGAPDLYRRPPLQIKPKKTPAAAAKPAAPAPLPANEAPTNAPQQPVPQPRRPSKPPKREDETLPDLPAEEVHKIAASIKPEMVRAFSQHSLGAAIASQQSVSELPALEDDGTTVLFSSIKHFRVHYETTIMHGGVIVRSAPMTVGTQRPLVLRIVPINEQYTVLGRVAFNGKDGSVGFMIEQFLHHRPQLEALAQRTEIAAR